MALFVNILGDGPSHDGDARRLVRSHVMRTFRQKEREASRLKWNAACKVMADVPCGPERSQFICLGHGGQGRREARGHTSNYSAPSEDVLDSSQTHTARDEPLAISRHVFKSPDMRNERSSCRRNAIQSSHPNAPKSPAVTAQSCKMYFAENISETVRSPEAYRQQLMLPFLELHYSATMPNLHLAFPKMQARLKSSQMSILTLATDAVLLHALALSKNDDSLLWVARRKNNKAIAGLRASLGTPKDNTSDEMLLTTDALGFFDASSSTAWRHHAHGLAALMEARGPSIYDNIGLLLHAPVLQLLMEALLSRSPFALGEEKWLNAMLPSCQTRMNRLIHLGCQVPKIVKRAEHYLSQKENMRAIIDIDSLLTSIATIERSLQTWLSDWYSADFQSKPPYTIASPAESIDVGPPPSLTPPPLRGSYTFPSLREAFGHNIFWTLLLTLRQAQYHLSASLPPTSPSILVAQQSAASETADSILRSSPFILRGVSGLPCGLPCSAGPLILVGRWYAVRGEGGNERKKWCERVVDVLTDGGQRPAGWITRSCAAWITAVL